MSILSRHIIRIVRQLPRRQFTSQTSSIDPDELNRFRQLSSSWWNETGEYAALHSS